jgi:hypothetical protein
VLSSLFLVLSFGNRDGLWLEAYSLWLYFIALCLARRPRAAEALAEAQALA